MRGTRDMNATSIDQVIAGAIEQEQSRPDPERHSIPWDDDRLRLLVVKLPLDALSLNHDSHRIKAQLSARSDRDHLLAAPRSERTQEMIASLLRETEEFQDLKADLGERGQQDPGVVTSEGVIINANTRAVALRDLDATHLRAMVLPPGATPNQIAELELRLQVAKDYKQAYTYTNKLLFIADCVRANWDEQRIADMVYGETTRSAKRLEELKRDLRVLTMIDELIEISGGQYGYPHFDKQQIALQELDRDYQRLKSHNPEAASRLRASRLAALLSGVGYREMREIDEHFDDGYLEDEIEESDGLAFLLDGEAANGADPEGLDLLGGGDSSLGETGERLLNWLTTTAGQQEVEVAAGDGDGVRRDRGEVVEAIKEAVDNAAFRARQDDRRENKIEAPQKAVRDAIRSLEKAENAFEEVATDPQFTSRVGKFRDKLDEADRRLTSLRARVESRFGQS